MVWEGGGREAPPYPDWESPSELEVHMTTRLERYLARFKNHAVVSVVLLFALAVIGLATFTDAVSKISGIARSWIVPTTKELRLRLVGVNEGKHTVRIPEFCRFYIRLPWEKLSFYEPSGRLRLEPRGDQALHSGAYAIESGGRAEFRVLFPNVPEYQDLLRRGAANLHLVIYPSPRGASVKIPIAA